VLDRNRHPQLTQRGLEGGAPTLDRLADDGDPLAGRAAAHEPGDLAGDELGRTARPRPFEEADGRVDRCGVGRPVDEQLLLDVRERGRRWPRRRTSQLLDRPPRELRELADRPLERGECDAAGLVGDGNGDVGPRRERLHERPLGAGQILEAVDEDRRARPGRQVAAKSLDRSPANAVAIRAAEPGELLTKRVDETREITVERIHVRERRFELADRCQRGVRKARRRRRAPEIVELEPGDRSPHHERALRLGRLGHPVEAPVVRDPAEDVVERPDRPREQRRPATKEVTFDAVDLGAIRNDEPRAALEHACVALEKQRDLAGVSRSDDERQTHSSIVVPASGAPSYGTRECSQRAPKGFSPS
jgi:hypothetical protein